MKTLIKQHPLSAYYALTFAISWGGFLLIVGPRALGNTNWQAEEGFLPAIQVMLMGPCIAGLLLTGLVDGRAGYRDLWQRLLTWRVNIGWFAVALLIAPIVSMSTVAALSIPSPLFAGGAAAAVILGGFGAAASTLLEEIGWTGFVVPRIRRRYSVFETGVIVGVLWALWHFLQQIFVSGTYAGAIPLPAFLLLTVFAAVVNLTAYRVLLVWVYDRTGSVLVTTLMHGSLTASTIFWFRPIATGALFLADVWIAAVAMWLVIGVVAVYEGWFKFGHTAPFRAPDGSVLPGSVAEAKYIRLGGVDQWVMIRGENIANPVMIVLHGGPGMSEMGFFRHYNAPLEHLFTVVNWDQRGTCKSFDRSIPRSSMTLEQFLADLDELVEIARRRFGKDKVVILGHSWGSALGAIYAARHPEKVSVYVGAAQIGDSAAGESVSYAYALAEAERQHNDGALKKLRAIGPPPYPAKSLFIERRIVTALDGEAGPSTWKTVRALFARPESSLLDLPKLLRGFSFTLDAMWAEVSKLNLLKLVPALTMPVVVFVGRRDHWVPPETSVAYFDMLTAPSKKLVWFEHSGHESFVDEPAKFNATMAELVRPLAA